MCTLIVLHRPDHDWPLLVGANRDELRDRPWRAPGRHWDDRPDVVAGLDEVAGGSWFGVNDHGLVAAVTNRQGSLGPEPSKRSRGELVLEALDHAEASAAAEALADLAPPAYRAFNLFVADPVAAFWLRHREDGSERIDVFTIPPGVHMLTAGDLDDETIPRIRHYLPRFRQAEVPDPAQGDWQAWQSLLASRVHDADEGSTAAVNIDGPGRFGTVCSHLVAVPRHPGFQQQAVFLFAHGAPDEAPFTPVSLG